MTWHEWAVGGPTLPWAQCCWTLVALASLGLGIILTSRPRR